MKKPYSAKELFEKTKVIKKSSFQNIDQDCTFPFNLNFKIKKCHKGKEEFSGPGIYIITYKKNVIYIGSYASKKPKIIEERWIKHIMTMTNRGYRIGFSAKTKRAKIPKDIKKFFEDADGKGFRYCDTGTVTTLERLEFANSYFHLFKRLHVSIISDSIISDFQFHYTKIPKCTEKDLKKIEKKLIEEYKPICNFLKKSIKKNNKINCKDVLKTLEKEIASKRSLY
jgi:hypothetical protein